MSITYGKFGPEFSAYETSKIVILPVPYDETSTWIKGADRAPQAIFEASTHLELYDIDTNTEIYRIGIHTAQPVLEKRSPVQMIDAVSVEVKKHLDNDKFVVTLGGEHSITVGPVTAFAEKVPGLCVLQIDAHTDLRQEYHGSQYNHACAMARVKEICPNIVQVGIRSMDKTELEYVDFDRVFLAKDIVGSSGGWVDRVLEKLDYNVYVTIDLDGMDPAVLPATGTPEPGGLSYYDVLNLLRRVTIEKNLVGFDVVELCPNEYSKSSDFLASKLIYQLLSYRFSGDLE
jgi:agmatinase